MKAKYLLAFCLILTSFWEAKAQIPINDSAWIIQPAMSDEFSLGHVDTISKWFPHYPWGYINNGAEMNLHSQLTFDGDTLKIKADTMALNVPVANSPWHNPVGTVHYAYKSGAIQSYSTNYKFGYIEISAEYPSGVYALWPAFWLWNCSSTWYNEIDIAENGAPDSYLGNTMGTNIHMGAASCGEQYYIGQTISGLPFIISSGFHKYAVEWDHDRINWYIDDSLVRAYTDASWITIPQNGLATIINFAISPYEAFLPSDWNNSIFSNYPTHGDKTPTNYPQYFKIDYMRYYKLNASNCGNLLSICSPHSDYPLRDVRKSITAGGISCTPTFNTSDGYTLRATDTVTLDAGATVNANGSGQFSIIIMPCPN